MKRILDPEFRYRPSYDTNIRETFEKARCEQREGQNKRKAGSELPLQVVRLERHGNRR